MSPWVRCAKALSVAALIMWFSFFGLYLYYDATRSTVGRPAEGRIYELNNHGHRVYLTRQERFGLRGLEGCSVAAFAVAFALGRWTERRARPLGESAPHGAASARRAGWRLGRSDGPPPDRRGMRLISSRSAMTIRRLFRVVWFGFLGSLALIQAVTWRYGFLLFSAGLAVLGFVSMREILFDLLDEVWEAGETLVLKKRGTEEHVAIADIVHVNYEPRIRPSRVTLTLRRRSVFGTQVAFSPSTPSVVDDLVTRVAACS